MEKLCFLQQHASPQFLKLKPRHRSRGMALGTLQVWFDADDGQRLLAELNLRCEAGWRYSAADQEEMGS